MSVLVVKAKVAQYTEEDLDNLLQDLPVAIPAPIVWRMQAIPIEEVKTITQFNRTKSLITVTAGYDILVSEPFETLWPKWKDLRKEYFKEIDFNNEESEKDLEEDED